MDSNQLFWATGINNGGLRTDAQQAEEIFRKLSVNVNKHLDSIIQKYKELQNNAKVKFENPVDQQMISSIKSQIGELSKVIDAEINKLGKFTATYDQSMQKIKTATAKISSGGRGGGKSSPLTPMVEGIKEDVGKADKELSFLARRFQYMWGSMLAYGSINMLKNLGSDIIRVKQQFEYAQVAIDSFVGSAEGGKKVFQDLMAFAVKSPMQMEDVTEAAKQWLAYGGSVDTVIDSVRMLSDISAGSGQNIKDLAYLYGTSMTQGRLYQRDLFQFANRGIPVYDALAKTMGKSKEQILALTSAGQVGFPELQKAIESLTAAGGQYYGLSEKMAEKTSGQISNLKDKWTMALKDIGDSQDGLINNSVQGITYLINHWEELSKAIIAAVAVYGTYKVASAMVVWQNAAEAASTNLVTMAKTKLIAVTRTLYTTMLAHPYAAAIVGITALVAIIWALHDSTTEAEKAQKRLAESIKGVQTAADDKIKGFNDRLNIIKSETAAAADQEKAYRELQMAYKDIIGDMTLKDLKTKESTVLQKANADAVAESRVAELKSLADATKARISIMQANLDDYVSKPGASRAIKLSISSKIKKDKQLLKDQTALYEQAQADLDKSKEDSEDKTLTIKEQIDLATDSVKKYKAELADLRSGKTPSADYAKDIEGKVKELKEAEDRLDILLNKPKDTAGGGGRVDKTQERLDAIIRDSEKIKDMQSKADIDLADAHVSELDNGYIKEKEQAEIEHERKKLDIKKKSEELLKLQNQIDANEFLAKNPNGVVPADATELNAKNQAIINTATEAEDVRYAAFTKKLLNDKLIEYGDYAAERLAIEKKYNDDIKALELERNATNTDSIDSAIRQANVEKSKALMAHSFKKLKESPEFAMAFEDLGNVSTETLEKLMAELNKYQQTAAGAMRLSDFKEYASVIENITDQLIERNPFKVLKESQDELNIAKSQLSLAKTTEDVAKAQDNVNRAYNKGEKARKEIIADTQELMDKFSSIGDAMGGQAGEIISYIGDIGTFAVTTADAIKTVANTTTTAIGAIEKASVVLGVISTAISLASKLISMLPKKETYQEKLDAINRMTQATDVYALAVAKARAAEAGWFGEDSLRDLKDTQEQMTLMISKIKEYNNARTTVKKEWGNWLKGGSSSYTTTKQKSLFAKTSDSYSGYIDLNNWVETNLKDAYGNAAKLFDENGLLNQEAYAAILVAFEGKLTDATQKTLEEMDKLTDEYNAMVSQLQEYVSDMYSPLADAWVSAIWDWVDTGKDAMDSFKDYASDTFRDIVSDLIRTLVLKNIVGGFSDDIQKAYTQYASGNMTEQALMAKVAELTAQMQGRAVAQTDAIQDVTKTIVDGLKATTGIDVTKAADTDANSTRSAIQSMSQESADILTAQFSAMRINIDKIRVEMGGIGGNMTIMNINVKDILLSLQTQAASLQMVFSDISRIAKNTDRLEAIENSLNKVLTNGVKAL